MSIEGQKIVIVLHRRKSFASNVGQLGPMRRQYGIGFLKKMCAVDKGRVQHFRRTCRTFQWTLVDPGRLMSIDNVLESYIYLIYCIPIYIFIYSYLLYSILKNKNKYIYILYIYVLYNIFEYHRYDTAMLDDL